MLSFLVIELISPLGGCGFGVILAVFDSSVQDRILEQAMDILFARRTTYVGTTSALWFVPGHDFMTLFSLGLRIISIPSKNGGIYYGLGIRSTSDVYTYAIDENVVPL